MNLSKFAEKLSELMFDTGYNGNTLSQKLNCGANTLYRYLQGERTPSLKMLVTLSEFFNCSVDYLIGLDDDNYDTKFNKCPLFKDRFPKLLETCNVTQYFLEKKTNISHSTMGYWKNGRKTPTIDNLIKIAKELNCSVDFVLGRTKE